MTARIRKFLNDLGDTFWLLPALMVFAGVLAALGLVAFDRSGIVPPWLFQTGLYDGGATGARTLLGAVASSTIGVAGTCFRSPSRHCLWLLARWVRLCCATSAASMPIQSSDLSARTSARRSGGLTTEKRQPEPSPDSFWSDATPVTDRRRGYLQQLDETGLANWAAEHNTSLRLLVRPGHYVFPGAPIAVMMPPVEGADAAISNATALGPQRVGSADLEFAVRQLVEVAVRALSPGVNDPHTAMSVLDRLGAGLCDIVPLHLPNGVHLRDDRVALMVPAIQYDGLLDAMFHMIRRALRQMRPC